MAAKNAQIERKALVAGAWLVAPELARVTSVIAARYRLNSEDAEEVLQETRIALWQAGLELRVCRTWVIRTAAHKAIDLIRRTVSRSDHEKASAQAAAPCENALELEYLLHARIAGLPVRLRVLYEMHYARGLTERETAVELGVCRQTVRWLDSQCRRSLAGSEALSDTRAPSRPPVMRSDGFRGAWKGSPGQGASTAGRAGRRDVEKPVKYATVAVAISALKG